MGRVMDAATALAEATGTHELFSDAVKVIDPRKE